MLLLLRTLYDITLLRKGPEDIPCSWLLLAATVALWLFAAVVTLVLIDYFTRTDFAIAVLSAVIGVGCYTGVLSLTGYGRRFLQTASAIIGCGALISIASVAGIVLFTPFLGNQLASIGAMIVLFWSVPVKGHIIARAIDRHWYAGIVIATAVFILQVAVTAAITPARN